jgi:hypothetical protein
LPLQKNSRRPNRQMRMASELKEKISAFSDYQYRSVHFFESTGDAAPPT